MRNYNITFYKFIYVKYFQNYLFFFYFLIKMSIIYYLIFTTFIMYRCEYETFDIRISSSIILGGCVIIKRRVIYIFVRL